MADEDGDEDPQSVYQNLATFRKKKVKQTKKEKNSDSAEEEKDKEKEKKKDKKIKKDGKKKADKSFAGKSAEETTENDDDDEARLRAIRQYRPDDEWNTPEEVGAGQYTTMGQNQVILRHRKLTFPRARE